MEVEKGQTLEATSPGSDEPTSDIPTPNAEVDGADSNPAGSSSGGGGTCLTRSSSLDNTADKFAGSEVDPNGPAQIANGRVDVVSETNDCVDRPDKGLSDGTHETDDDAVPVPIELEEKSRHDSSVGVEMMSVENAAGEQDHTEGPKNVTEEKVKCASPSLASIKTH